MIRAIVLLVAAITALWALNHGLVYVAGALAFGVIVCAIFVRRSP